MLDAMTAVPSRKATYAEYLALERSSETKHEYVNGELYAMAGGSPEHARLAFELGYLLKAAFGDKPCRVFSSDARVRVEATDRSAYPDLTIVCGALETSPTDPDAIVNPTVLVEVLSPSTETTDRLEKWAHYRRIPSLQAYVLVAQDEARIETYRRDGRRWIYEEAGPGEVVRIGGIEVDVAIDALYASALPAAEHEGTGR
jgi:Uma2 family endonuclease